jgi:ankyrin repeat protein
VLILAKQPAPESARRPSLPAIPGSRRSTAAVRALLAAGVPVDARGEMGATALHWACWKGYADLVELLLSHSAPLTIEDEQFHGTPPGWFGHGVRNCHQGDGDYPQVARLLISAGVPFPSTGLPTGNPAVDAVLRARTNLIDHCKRCRPIGPRF